MWSSFEAVYPEEEEERPISEVTSRMRRESVGLVNTHRDSRIPAVVKASA